MLPLTKDTAARFAAGLPEAARARIEAGAERYVGMPMPDPADEDWRYVDLGIDLDDYGIPEAPGAAMPAENMVVPALPAMAGRAVIRDGAVVEVDGDGLVCLATLDAADTRWWGQGPAAISNDLDRFAASHHAFGRDAVLVRVPAGVVVPDPYLIEIEAVTPGALVLPRVVVAVEDGAEASVVVIQRSPDGADLVVVPHLEATVGANANLTVTAVQAWGDRTTGVAQHRYSVGRDGAVELNEAGLGGRFSRFHLILELAGQGADAKALGLYFGDGERTMDYRALMHHVGPNTTSEMFLKGAVGDRARGVFTGLIRIEPSGQRTNAHQSNHNLVLSEGAEAHSVPNLEILANDVRCGHGSTVGPLGADQRYYMMSRGLDRPAADRLQVKGFFEDVLARFRHQSLEPPLRRSLMSTYDGITGRAGR